LTRRATRDGKPRLSGTVETVDFAVRSHRSLFALLPETFDKARKECHGYDVYFLEAEWRKWAEDKEAPRNADAAFIAFARKYAQEHPIN
jgi:hypothetical protein